MSLFDTFEIRNSAPPRHRRREFEYLNQTGISQGSPVRELLDCAFANFTSDKTDVRNRFRSPGNTPHVSAAFELILHELMVRQGLKPSSEQLKGGGKPDIKITLPTGGSAFIEARMLDDKENTHFSAACDAIDSIRRENIRFDVRILSEPTQPITQAKLLTGLTAFVQGLDIESLTDDATNPATSKFVYQENDACLQIAPVFDSDFSGGLGICDIPDSEMPNASEIRKGIKKKKSKYRELTDPYIVAICSAKGFVQQSDFEEALFRESRGEEGQDKRGLWTKGEASRVSAVLACYNFKPSSLSGATMQLFLNPNAANPLTTNPFGCEQVVRSNGKLARTSGLPVRALLKLPENWCG